MKVPHNLPRQLGSKTEILLVRKESSIKYEVYTMKYMILTASQFVEEVPWAQ